jgi:hypothetical protein
MYDKKVVNILGTKEGNMYMKEKSNDLETDSRTALYGGINTFKKGYGPGTNMIKDKNGDLVADCNSR